MFPFGPTWGIKDEEKMEKLFYKVLFETNLMSILFYYISQVMAQKNVTPLSQKCEEKTIGQCHSGWPSLKKNNFIAPFYGWGSTAPRLQPLRGGILLFTAKFPKIPSTYFIDLGRMND